LESIFRLTFSSSTSFILILAQEITVLEFNHSY